MRVSATVCIPTLQEIHSAQSSFVNVQPLSALLLNVVHATFNFALVARHSRFGRQQDSAVMIAETLQLGIQVQIVPVGLDHGRF